MGIRAVVVDPQAHGHLAFQEIDSPTPNASEALVRVEAISLNRGEVRRVSSAAAASADSGWRPGWDLAGVVEQAAADGSGPPLGARVVGILDSGAWAEEVAVPTEQLAELPSGVSFAQAATLPIAGLTALWTLEHGGSLLDRTVLITGASGGVGNFACQLARLAGARVVGVVGSTEHAAVAHEAGAHEVIVGHALAGAESFGPYHLILDSVGGQGLAAALPMLGHGGTCVIYGTTGGPQVTIDARDVYSRGGVSIYGFIIFYEMTRRPPAEDLSRLAHLVADGRLHPPIAVEASWNTIGDVAQQLTNRSFTGKAVLRIQN